MAKYGGGAASPALIWMAACCRHVESPLASFNDCHFQKVIETFLVLPYPDALAAAPGGVPYDERAPPSTRVRPSEGPAPHLPLAELCHDDRAGRLSRLPRGRQRLSWGSPPTQAEERAFQSGPGVAAAATATFRPFSAAGAPHRDPGGGGGAAPGGVAVAAPIPATAFRHGDWLLPVPPVPSARLELTQKQP